MNQKLPNIDSLLSEIESLKSQLNESNSVIEAIANGAVDALVMKKSGQPQVYSLESADYIYRILIEKFGEGALSISPDGLILYCNECFSKLIGIPANKIKGTYFDSYMDDPNEFQELKSMCKYGPSKGEIVLKARERKCDAYVSLTDLHPNVAAIGVVVTDLTEQRRHESDLVQYQNQLEVKVNELNLTNANLEQFIHVISHDIKEPLRKIVSYTSHLGATKAAVFTDAELKNLGIINASALRLNSLVDDLVKYALNATAEENTARVDFNTIVREVKDDLELVIKENQATIECDELPTILASKVQLRQLFANLISNAIKYSKKETAPKIKITSERVDFQDSVSKTEKNYKITITDNGIGMNSGHLNKIFTIFQRLHRRNEYSGNGIGLAICKKIMENHHGKIEVESQLNKGSSFCLYFPITQ